MRINLKAIGLALVAAFAISAFAASTASAETIVGQLTTEGEKDVTLTGEDGEGTNAFTAFEEEVSCPNSTYTGHQTKTPAETTESSEHNFLNHGETSVTVTPHYLQEDDEGTANCDVNGGALSATITMNGCDYDFNHFTPLGGGAYSFTADLVCPHGVSAAVVDVYLGHTHGFKLCTISIPAQEGLEGFEAENTEGGLHLSGGTKGITVSESGLCGSNEESKGAYNVDVDVTAHDTDGEPIGISLSEENIR